MRLLGLLCAAGVVACLLGCPTYTDVIGPDDPALEEAAIDPAMGTGVIACTRWQYGLWEADEGCTIDEPCEIPDGWEPFGVVAELDGAIHIRRCLANY